MGKRIIVPAMITAGYKTEVTIVPTSVVALQMEDYRYPAAHVQIDYCNNDGQPLCRATFRKILDENPYPAVGQSVVSIADKMINGNLSAVGLDGLCTLDIYKAISLMRVPASLNMETMKAILQSSLGITYDDNSNHVSCIVDQTADCFFDLKVVAYKAR